MGRLKYAFRTLAKTPFVTTIAVLSLALGIGANAAIYSLFDQMLLRPLPVQAPGRLVNLGAPGPKPGSQSCNQAGNCDEVFSYAMFRDLQKAGGPFSGVAAHRLFGANLAGTEQTISAEGMLVSGSYFPVLGLQPALGRLLDPEDDKVVGQNFVAVLSYAYWQNHWGGSPDVLNRTVTINGHPMTIVGVAPRGFEGTTLGSKADVFVPLSMAGLMRPGFNGFDNRTNYWAYVFARLKPGMSIDRARSEINTIYHGIITDVEAPLQEGMSDQTMTRFRAKKLTVEPGKLGQSSVHREARTPLILLFSITALVLLIACANIANLLLARGAARAQEMAIRASIGAGRGRLLGQLLLESLILAVLGGAASLLIARWTLALIISMLPPAPAATFSVAISPAVMGFAAALAIGTGILFGMYPALHSTRPDLVTTIRSASGQPSGARSAARFRTSLVTAQIALSMALLVAAGLFIKSLINVSHIDVGMKVDHVVTFSVSPTLNGYTPERTGQLFQQVEDQLGAIPGVTAVTEAMVPTLSGSNWGTDVSVDGFESGPDVNSNARYNEVGADYFRTMGIPLLAGREFTKTDDQSSQKVAIVNQEFMKKFGLTRQTAIGAHMGTNGRSNKRDIEIVGIAKDAKYGDVKQVIPPLFVVPYRQDKHLGWITFYVRTAVDPAQVMRAVPPMMKRLDPNLPVENLKTLEEQARESVFLDRLIGTLSAAFALLATLLAAVGLYGVLSYTVAQRTREIGVRMALGAGASRVRGMVLRQVAWMLITGGVVGAGGAYLVARGARSLLYQMSGYDPTVVVTVTVVLAAIGLAAGYLPALRASRVDPMQALRYE